MIVGLMIANVVVGWAAGGDDATQRESVGAFMVAKVIVKLAAGWELLE